MSDEHRSAFQIARQSFSRMAVAAALLANGVTPARADVAARAGADVPPAPEQLYGELFVAVQSAPAFEDSKTFADAIPKRAPARILERYRAQKADPEFDLESFVRDHFTLPEQHAIHPPEGRTLRDHINGLWPELTRRTPLPRAWSSLIPLPEPYVVPGGRFREVYYWDSYFTMLGLEEAGRSDLVISMVDNFAHAIDEFGHIPNGNRTYYLSRSQPPFFSHMVELVAERDGMQTYAEYLSQLQQEHAYWMEGEEQAQPGDPVRRVVALPDGNVLNRYWDELDTPRTEAYAQDVETARRAPERRPEEVYRDLRAAAESGWDFSSRWLGDARTLETIRTTAIVPVDLNSLLFHLEISIVKGCAVQLDIPCVKEYVRRASRRARGIDRYLWNERGYYADYDWELGETRDDPTAAMLYPLFVGVASRERALCTADQVQALLLEPGGLATTTHETGQQWDAPNGWAPLHWIAIQGLLRYSQAELARRIGTRFLTRVSGVYECDGKLVEKYRVDTVAGGGGGGEYPLQDGFGWTNGVTLKLLELYGPAPAPPSGPECGGSLTD